MYAHKAIALNKIFNIFTKAYHFNTLPLPIFTTEIIDKIMSCYLYLLLTQVDDFYRVQVEHKITRLDIIIAQTINWVSTLKVAFSCI